MALRHRLRRDPLDETGSTSRIARAIVDLFDGG
jgi:magnesium chelatase subunit I